MNTRTNMNMVLHAKTLAMAGVSRNNKKFGYLVFKTLREKGLNIIPVNPQADIIDGIQCMHTIQELPPEVDSLLIVTHRNDCKKVVQEAINKGIKNIWIQNGCETEEAIHLAQSNNINLVSKACIMMYADPKGIHKFHQRIVKLFGQYVPEEINT